MKRKPAGPTVPNPPQPAPHPAPHKPAPQHPATGPINPRLYATMDKAALDQSLAGIQLNVSPGGTHAVLSQDFAVIDDTILPLARTANTLLPIWQIDSTRRGIYLRQTSPQVEVYALNVSAALRNAGRQGIQFTAQPDHVDDLLKKRSSFASFSLIGKQLTNIGLDQRQISGAFLIFLSDRVVTSLDRRIKDPKVPDETKHKLLNDFGPALIALDEVLRAPQLRKDELLVQRTDLEQQAQDAEAEAQLKDTTLRVRQNLVLPRESLFAAARRHMTKVLQQQNPGVLGDQPAVTPAPVPPAGPHNPRKII